MAVTTSQSHQLHEAAQISRISWQKWEAEEGDEEDIGADVTDHVLHTVLGKSEGLCGHIVLLKLRQVS